MIKEVASNYEKCEVSVHQLKFGMYVRELDRPWLDAPFKFQGFYIRSIEDIQKLQELCDHVFIDLDRSRHLGTKVNISTDSKTEKKFKEQREQFWLPDSEILKNVDYEDAISLEDELISAKESRTNAVAVVESLYADIRSGLSIDSTSTKTAIISLVDSVIRNPDAHALLALLDERDEQRVTHSLNVCILALTFGRLFGFPRQYMIELGLGAMLHDVGQAKIPLEIVTKKGPLTDEEYEIMKSHTTLGMELLLNESRQLPYRTIDIVYTHHERYDGHGYPQELVGKAIPLYGRIVAIADFYEAVTSEYADREMLTPGTAMTELFTLRGVNFDENLVEEFIKCIGIFPIGCTVLLKSGEVGIVIAQNRKSRLKPRLMLILDKEEAFYPVPRLIDIGLFKGEEEEEEEEDEFRVVRIVSPNEYGIDVKHYIGNMINTIVKDDRV